jgi:hypothetical protein
MLHGGIEMVKDQEAGKQTSFRFSATAVRELDWLVHKLGQTQTTVVETSIHRLAEAEGYDRDPKELITALLAHESGHAILVEALMERGIRIGPDARIEIRRVGGEGDAKAEIAGVASIEIRRANPGGAGSVGETQAPRPPKITKARRRS